MREPIGIRRLSKAFSYVDDTYLDLVERERNGGNARGRRGKALRGAVWPIAACVCVLLLPLGVFAARCFSLWDLILPGEEDPVRLESISGSDAAQRDLSGRAELSLSGYMDRPEAQALAEWNRFLEAYDPDHAILDRIGNGPVEGLREEWSFYNVYTEEMGEKLDAIAEKYGLKLHTQLDTIDPEELMYRVGGEFMDRDLLTWAYLYEDGGFHVEGDGRLQDGKTVEMQIGRSVKGTFNEVTLSVEDAEQYTQWQYRTVCGEVVLLALHQGKALILADFPDCFVAVNVLSGSEGGLTGEDLQELADSMDFRVLKEVRIPEMRGDSVVSPEEVLLSKLWYGELGDLGTGTLAFTVPGDDQQDYRLCFFADRGEEGEPPSSDVRRWRIEDAAYRFPDLREGNLPIGTFQTFDAFWIEDMDGDKQEDIVLIGLYGVGQELCRDARVYTEQGAGYVLNEELTAALCGADQSGQDG